MYLVREDEHVVAEATLGHAFKFAARKHAADRVMGIAKHEELRPLANGPVKEVPVDLVASVGSEGERRFLAFKPVPRRCAEDRAVTRNLDKYAVARVPERLERNIERRDYARQEEYRVRFHVPIVTTLQAVTDDIEPFWLLAAITEEPVLHALTQGANDRLRRPQVHVRDEHRQHIRWVVVPLVVLGARAVVNGIEVVHGDSSSLPASMACAR